MIKAENIKNVYCLIHKNQLKVHIFNNKNFLNCAIFDCFIKILVNIHNYC